MKDSIKDSTYKQVKTLHIKKNICQNKKDSYLINKNLIFFLSNYIKKKGNFLIKRDVFNNKVYLNGRVLKYENVSFLESKSISILNRLEISKARIKCEKTDFNKLAKSILMKGRINCFNYKYIPKLQRNLQFNLKEVMK